MHSLGRATESYSDGVLALLKKKGLEMVGCWVEEVIMLSCYLFCLCAKVLSVAHFDSQFSLDHSRPDLGK